MPSPACVVNSAPVPADVAANSVPTIALVSGGGVVFWGLTCIGTDETTTAAAINATLSVNTSLHQATFTAQGLGTAYIFQSTVGVGSKSQQGAGCDANNAVVQAFTTTFKVNVKASNGNRVLVVNEVYEQDSTFGWINEVNSALRNEQTGSAVMLGDVTGTTAASVVSGISGVSPIAITPASLSWALGTAAPTITQSTQVSNAAPNNLTITPQAPNAGAGNTANGTPGSLIVSLVAPVSTGNEPGFQVQRAGALLCQVGNTGGASLWLGSGITPAAGNQSLIANTTTTWFNAQSTVNLSINGTGGVVAIVTANGLQIGTTTAFGGGAGVLGVANAGTAPTTNPSGGGILFAASGAGKWRGSSGTVTTFGPAEPHCDVCGSDFVTEHESDCYGYLSVCLKCMADELGDRAWIRRTKKGA